MSSVANTAPAGACVGPSGVSVGVRHAADDAGATDHGDAPRADPGRSTRGVGHGKQPGSLRGPIPCHGCDGAAVATGGAAARGVSGAAASPGLVSSKTSDSQRVRLERNPARIKRMQNTVRESSRLLQDETGALGRRFWALFLTFTYAPGLDWEPRHMTAFVKAVRDYLARRRLTCRYVWVLELHQSGRPHYHAVLWLPHGMRLPKPDLRGWWPHGATRIERARSPVGYLAKYASKGIPQTDADDGRPAIPKGARL